MTMRKAPSNICSFLLTMATLERSWWYAQLFASNSFALLFLGWFVGFFWSFNFIECCCFLSSCLCLLFCCLLCFGSCCTDSIFVRRCRIYSVMTVTGRVPPVSTGCTTNVGLVDHITPEWSRWVRQHIPTALPRINYGFLLFLRGMFAYYFVDTLYRQFKFSL